MKRHILTTLSMFLLFAPTSGAQVTETNMVPPSISVSGNGKVRVRPDTAEFSVGVSTVAPTAASALTDNNGAMSALLAVLKTNGINERDISTRNFTVYPEYRTEQAGNPQISAYRVGNEVHVRVRNIAALGSLLDATVRSGASNINNITFSLDSPDPIIDKARALAVADAKRKAEIYAQASGVKLGRVLYISESGTQQPPQPHLTMSRAGSMVSVPVSIGEDDLQSSVSVVYAIE